MTTTTAPKHIERLYRTTRSGRRSCWTVIVDGVWRVERDEDRGTTWSVKHLPTGIILPTLSGGRVWRSEAGATVATVFGTVDRAIRFIEDGRAQALLDQTISEAA
jgi:hypothetical protein